MTAFERWCLRLSAAFAILGGTFYGWLRYFAQRAGEFGAEPHPLQGLAQHLHVVTTPFLVFAFGMLFRNHALAMLRTGQPSGLRSGWVMLLSMGPMILSGYGVQVAVDANWRIALAWIHGIASVFFVGGLLIHTLRAFRMTRYEQAKE